VPSGNSISSASSSTPKTIFPTILKPFFDGIPENNAPSKA